MFIRLAVGMDWALVHLRQRSCVHEDDGISIMDGALNDADT